MNKRKFGQKRLFEIARIVVLLLNIRQLRSQLKEKIR